MDIRGFRIEDEPAVILLWEQCGLVRPWNDAIDFYRAIGNVPDDVVSMGKRLETVEGDARMNPDA